VSPTEPHSHSVAHEYAASAPYKLHKDLSSLTRTVHAELDRIARDLGLDTRLCLVPAIMLTDWGTLSLRYALPEWFRPVQRTYRRHVGSASRSRAPSFAAVANLSAPSVEQFATDLHARYLEHVQHGRDVWALFHAYSSGKDKVVSPGDFERLIQEPPAKTLEEVAMMAIGLLPQPLNQGLAGYVLRTVKPAALRLDYSRFPRYPVDVPVLRTTNSLHYQFMQYLERHYIGLHHPYLVVSPIVAGTHKLGVLIVFVQPRTGRRLFSRQLQDLARALQAMTINSRFSTALTAVITAGIGELAIRGLVDTTPHGAQYLGARSREWHIAQGVLQSIGHFVPSLFCGAVMHTAHDDWRLHMLGEHRHTTYPAHDVASDDVGVPVTEDGILAETQSMQLLQWRVDAHQCSEVVMRRTASRSVCLNIPLLQHGSEVPVQQRRHSIQMFREHRLLRRVEGAAVLVPLSANTVLWFCLPFSQKRVKSREFSILNSLTAILHDYRSAFAYYDKGQRDVLDVLAHETAHFFLSLPDMLERILASVNTLPADIADKRVSGRELDPDSRSTIRGALAIGHAASMHATGVFRGIAALTQVRRFGPPDHMLERGSVQRAMEDIRDSALDRTRCKLAQKLRDTRDLDLVDISLPDDIEGTIPVGVFRIVMENLLANATYAALSEDDKWVAISAVVVEESLIIQIRNSASGLSSARGAGLFLASELCAELGWDLRGPVRETDRTGSVVVEIVIPSKETGWRRS